MKLSKRETKLLILAVVIITTVSLSKWVINPLINQYQDLNSKLMTEKHLWQKNKLLLQSGNKFTRKLEKREAELEAVDSLFFHHKIDKVKLETLSTLDKYIQDTNLAIKNKNLQLEKLPDKGLTRVIYRLNLEGELRELVNFLKELNQTDKLFMVDYLDLTSNHKANQLSINLQIKVVVRGGDLNEK